MNKTVPAYLSMLPRPSSKENKQINREKIVFKKMNSSSILGFILTNYFL